MATTRLWRTVHYVEVAGTLDELRQLRAKCPKIIKDVRTEGRNLRSWSMIIRNADGGHQALSYANELLKAHIEPKKLRQRGK
jgi:hypothetical protein